MRLLPGNKRIKIACRARLSSVVKENHSLAGIIECGICTDKTLKQISGDKLKIPKSIHPKTISE
jgi:hypothetical protein